MEQKIGFGTALPDGGWQRMQTQDPAPRIPFCCDEPVTRSEAGAWAGVALFIFCVISLIIV